MVQTLATVVCDTAEVGAAYVIESNKRKSDLFLQHRTALTDLLNKLEDESDPKKLVNLFLAIGWMIEKPFYVVDDEAVSECAEYALIGTAHPAIDPAADRYPNLRNVGLMPQLEAAA